MTSQTATTAAATSRQRTAAQPRPDRLRPMRRAGVGDVLPIAVANVPFAMAAGLALSTVETIPSWAAVLSGPLLASGAASLAVAALLAGGAGPVSVLAAIAILNGRYIAYGGALAPRFATQPVWFRLIGPHLIGDSIMAVTSQRDDLQAADRFRDYWLAAGLVNHSLWAAGVAVGVAVGPVLPANGPLAFAGTASVIGLLAATIRGRTTAAAALAAAVVAVVAGLLLSPGVGLTAGVAAGLAVGAVVTR